MQYKDEDGDLVEISSDQELRTATRSCPSSMRMFLVPCKKAATMSDIVPIKELIIDEKTLSGMKSTDTLVISSEKDLDSLATEEIDPSAQLMKDFELAQQLANMGGDGVFNDGAVGESKNSTMQVLDKAAQEEEDLRFARLLHEQENGLPDNRTALLGAAALGAGIGLLAGGSLMAVAGAGIAVFSASETGRRRVGEVAVSTGRAASEAGRRLTEATEQHRERARVAAAVLSVQASEARARTNMLARDAIHRAQEVQAGGLGPAPVSATVGRIVSVAGTAIDRVSSRFSQAFRRHPDGIIRSSSSSSSEVGGSSSAFNTEHSVGKDVPDV